MILQIQIGTNNPILRQKAKKVKHINSKIKEIISNMIDTVRSNEIIAGLAATQIGHSLQIIVIDLGNKEESLTLINPEIEKTYRRKIIMEESCMSVPNQSILIKRPNKIIVKAIDINNNPVKIKAKGILARIIQHEIDHLNGILICDYK